MNIIFVGYRGTGKTAIGRTLADTLDYEFVDTDDEIVREAGMPVPEIFSRLGEAKFREIEAGILVRVSSVGNTVISTGGGMVLKPENRAVIRNSGFCVYLTADPNVIFGRIHLDSNRPSLTGKDPMTEIGELLDKRRSFSEEVAMMTLDTGKNSINECVRQIMMKIEKKAGV